MRKIRYTCLLLLFTSAVIAQSAKNNSPVKAAKADAKHFRLNDEAWKTYKHTLPATSDYFKPRKADVSDTTMLNDSVYVNAYRQEAFKRNMHRRTTGHYVLLGGGIAAGLFALAIIAVLIFIAPNME